METSRAELRRQRRVSARWAPILPEPTEDELRRARVSARLSQEKAAAMMGVSGSTWYTWESPKYSVRMPAFHWYLFQFWARHEPAPPPTENAPHTPVPVRLSRIRRDLSAIEEAYALNRRL